MTTITKFEKSRRPVRLQFTAWGEMLAVESLSSAFKLRGSNRVLESKGQLVTLSSGSERLVKIGRFCVWKDTDEFSCQQVLEEMIGCLLALGENFQAQFLIELSRLDCLFYYTAGSEKEWELVLSPEIQAGLALRGIEVAIDIMP